MDGEFDHLVERLESIAEEITDLGMQELRESIETGEPSTNEKRLGQARRAVSKAAYLLSDQNAP